MPIYKVTVNKALPADRNGRVYHHITTVLKADERDVNCPIGAQWIRVLSTDPRASVAVDQEFTVTPVPVSR